MRVVITGAGSGIGEATALRWAGRGATVECVDINAHAAQATADACGGDSRAWTCDVAVRDEVFALAEEIGEVDVCVNNAGVGIAGPFLEAGTDDWDWLMGINLDGVAYGCHAFGAGMVARGRGHVVNVASGAAYMMSRDMAAYCASKAAVLAFSRCLRADWASSGVGVSVVCPGVINTPIVSATRMVGPMSGKQASIQQRFRHGHSPDAVAKAIVRAAEKNQEVVPVGFESELAYRVLPFVPGPVKSLMTRTSLGSVL